MSNLKTLKDAHAGLVAMGALKLTASDTPGTYGMTEAGVTRLELEESIFRASHV